MNLRNVRLILFREIRDQLRDRRTLFMIFVLPLLLYPLLGMSLSQVVQFRRASRATCLPWICRGWPGCRRWPMRPVSTGGCFPATRTTRSC